MITKLGKIARDSKGQLRDYSKEYSTYHSSKDQIKNRVLRNMARRKSGLKVGDPREVDHKIPLSKGGSGSTRNTRVVSRGVNRKKFVKVANPILAALTHVGQNIFMDKQLANPRFHKYLLSRMSSAVTGKSYISKLQALKNGALGGIVPEVSILGDEAHHLASKLKPLITSTSTNGVTTVDKRSLVLLRALAKGDFKNLSKLTITNKNKAELIKLLSATDIPEKGKIISAVKNNTLGSSSVIKDLEESWGNNRVTGKLMHGIGDLLGKKPITTGSNLSGKIERGGRVLGLGGLTAIDPITGGVNIAKHIYADRSKFTRPLNVVRRNISKATLVNPVRKNFYSGKHGTLRNKFVNTVDRFGFNPIIHGMKQFSNNLGSVAKKYNV